MTGYDWVFLAMALVTAGGALAVVTTRNVVHGALALVISLGGVALIYFLLTAPFVALAQLLIYVGAIVILLLFALMLTRAPLGTETLDNPSMAQRLIGATVASALFGLMAVLLTDGFRGKMIDLSSPTSTSVLGESLFRYFVLPFEAVSMLLLAALVGSIVLARKD
ncbi:MAG: NADH-quinone oxidoreductase subunit J [Actinomycetota bacterium]